MMQLNSPGSVWKIQTTQKVKLELTPFHGYRIYMKLGALNDLHSHSIVAGGLELTS